MQDDLSFSEARVRLREVLDRAERGRTVTMRRGGTRYVDTEAERFRDHLASANPPRLRIAREDDRWVASLDRLPLVAEAQDLDSAIDALIEPLQEYADDWEEYLQHAPNHREQWALVQLVILSNDDELCAWLRSEASPKRPMSSSEKSSAVASMHRPT